MSQRSPEASLAFDRWQTKFNELPASTQQVLAESLLGQSLELYINPTEKCNFRCTYCYEDFALGRMKPPVIDAVKKFIRRNMAGRKTLYLNWFGGEPLTAAGVVLDISAYAQDLCAELGAHMTGGITTNGYVLKPELMQDLVSVKQRTFQISLDGDPEAHDAVRKRADGKSTFHEIWANLEALRATPLDFSILIRVHIRPGNRGAVERLLEMIRSAFGSDSRFHVGLHGLLDMGGPTGGTFEVLSGGEYADISNALIAKYGDILKIAVLEGEIATTSQQPVPAGDTACHSHVCYASKGNSFLIRPDGRVGKCTVALDKDYNDVGSLDSEGQLVLDRQKMKKWTVGLYTLDAHDLSCPLQKGDRYFQAGAPDHRAGAVSLPLTRGAGLAGEE